MDAIAIPIPIMPTLFDPSVKPDSKCKGLIFKELYSKKPISFSIGLKETTASLYVYGTQWLSVDIHCIACFYREGEQIRQQHRIAAIP